MVLIMEKTCQWISYFILNRRISIMTHHLSRGCTCILLLLLLIGVCMAEEIPSSLIFVQGGESVITEGTDGLYLITVQDIIPYLHIKTGERSSLMPFEILTTLDEPLNVALVFSGADTQSTSMVEVSNLSLSNDTTGLTLTVKPLEFYDGQLLTFFESEKNEGNTIFKGQHDETRIYIEEMINPPDNVPDSFRCGQCYGIPEHGCYQACCWDYEMGKKCSKEWCNCADRIF
jgi:hypothetical protein